MLDLAREHYGDFGPTLAAEKLLERHRIALSNKTLRQWMTKPASGSCDASASSGSSSRAAGAIVSANSFRSMAR